MLILTRKPGQLLYIGADIQVVFLDIPKKNVIKIGVTAPEGVVVLRNEVRERLLINNSDEKELFNGSRSEKNATGVIQQTI